MKRYSFPLTVDHEKLKIFWNVIQKQIVENMILEDLRFKTGEKKSLKYKNLNLLDMLNFQLRCDMDKPILSSSTIYVYIFFFIQVIDKKLRKFNISNKNIHNVIPYWV